MKSKPTAKKQPIVVKDLKSKKDPKGGGGIFIKGEITDVKISSAKYIDKSAPPSGRG